MTFKNYNKNLKSNQDVKKMRLVFLTLELIKNRIILLKVKTIFLFTPQASTLHFSLQINNLRFLVTHKDKSLFGQNRPDRKKLFQYLIKMSLTAMVKILSKRKCKNKKNPCVIHGPHLATLQKIKPKKEIIY